MNKHVATVHPLPIVVTHRVRVVEYKGISYVRTRDIADALKVKQPFEFTSDIKQKLGLSAVLSGEFTANFRDEEDNARTPYVRVSDMIDFLEEGVMLQKTNGTRMEVIDVLKTYLNQPNKI